MRPAHVNSAATCCWLVEYAICGGVAASIDFFNSGRSAFLASLLAQNGFGYP